VHLLNSQKTTFLHLFRRTVLFANSAAGISVFNTSAKEVVFFVSVCLFVCLFAVLRKKNYSTDFHKTWWKGGMGHGRTIRCWWYVVAGGTRMTARGCLLVTILRRQQHWRKYAFYWVSF